MGWFAQMSIVSVVRVFIDRGCVGRDSCAAGLADLADGAMEVMGAMEAIPVPCHTCTCTAKATLDLQVYFVSIQSN